jgi:transposase-like protein
LSIGIRFATPTVLPQSELESRLVWVSITRNEDFSMSRPRRHFSAPQKAEIVRRHLAGKEPVSNLADEFQLQPTQIHAWVKQVLDRAEQAFASTSRAPDDGKDRKIAALQEKLAKKNEVVAELMEEHVQLKKELGEL